MDSKSISREGVGVRLPSLAPDPTWACARASELRAVASEVGAVLWEVVARELRSARGELEQRRALVREATAGALPVAGPSLDALELRARRHGWCLGLVARGTGIDLLGARCERSGLRWMLATLSEGLGFDLRPRSDELPDLPALGWAWELALLAAWCALEAGRRSAGRVEWEAGALGGGQRLAFGLAAVPAELARRCTRLDGRHRAGPAVVPARRALELHWS